MVFLRGDCEGSLAACGTGKSGPGFGEAGDLLHGRKDDFLTCLDYAQLFDCYYSAVLD